MKCPKCGEELETGMKFCTRCGVNVDDAIRELAERVQREEEEQRIAEENKKREEEQKQEELRREAERIEKEKQRLEEEKRRLEEDRLRAEKEAEELKRIREENAEKERLAAENAEKAIQASENALAEEKEEQPKEIENQEQKSNFEPVNKAQNENGFKPAQKQKKGYKGKGFLRRFIDRLILIIILIAIIIVGVYYLNINGYLPEEISEEINSVIDQSKEVKSSMDGEYKKDKNDNKKYEDDYEKDNSKWNRENNIDAEDIFDLDEYVSGIIVDGKYGIIDNFTGRILLDTKYEDVKIEENNKIIVKDNGKYYSLDSRYQLSSEVSDVTNNTEKVDYIYNTIDNKIYTITNEKILEEINKSVSNDNERYIIVKEARVNEDDITEANSKKSIDYENIKFTEKYGIYDTIEEELISECEYSKILNYSEGFAAAKDGAKAGFIDENGEEVMFEYEETRSVHSGYAFVKQDGKWGVLKIKD